MSQPVKGYYRHYKGDVYQVLGTLLHTETNEEMVWYRSVTKPCEMEFVRPLKMWNETVTIDETRHVPRFTMLKSVCTIDLDWVFTEFMATSIVTRIMSYEPNLQVIAAIMTIFLVLFGSVFSFLLIDDLYLSICYYGFTHKHTYDKIMHWIGVIVVVYWFVVDFKS